MICTVPRETAQGHCEEKRLTIVEQAVVEQCLKYEIDVPDSKNITRDIGDIHKAA